MLLHNIMWVHATSKIIFVIIYLLEYEQELSLGMLIRPKRIYNFWCSMLVLHQFYHCFIYVWVCFYKFSWQDAEVPVPVFCCFWFQKSYTGNILGNGRDKNQKSYICRGNTENRSENEMEHQGNHTTPRRGLALAHAWGRWGHPGHHLTPPLRLFNPRHGYTLSTRAQFHENHWCRRHRQP